MLRTHTRCGVTPTKFQVWITIYIDLSPGVVIPLLQTVLHHPLKELLALYYLRTRRTYTFQDVITALNLHESSPEHIGLADTFTSIWRSRPTTQTVPPNVNSFVLA